MGWRLIDTDIADSLYVTAADEAIALSKKDTKVPNTLHFYRRTPATVSVGRSRQIHKDINVEECKKNKVLIVRRTTGGGTIFTDEGCLIYSLVFDKSIVDLGSSSDIFKKVYTSLMDSLQQFNISTKYKAPNDLLLNEKKISGSAQINKDTIVLIHGTLLVDTDLNLMKKVLKVKGTTPVSTLRQELGIAISCNELKKQIKKGFEQAFHTTFYSTSFSMHETNLIKTLLKEKYETNTWNFIR
jgi:lipoate-protein ligase A